MSNLTPSEVDIVFRCILGRSPESERTSKHFQEYGSIDRVIEEVRASVEAQSRLPTHINPSPFWNYNTNFDARKTIAAHEDVGRCAVADRIVNFLGVKIPSKIYPPSLHGREGQVEGLPLPGNWHADIAEFAAALRAVDLASNTFRVIELGCGWGCWLLNTGVAARNKNLLVDLIGVEADEGHAAFAREILVENGFNTTRARVIRGIVGPNEGTALFPRQDHAGESWGLEPVFHATEDQIAQAGDKYDLLPVITLRSLAKDGILIDLVHIDIQGGETDFLQGCIDDLSRLVSYVVVGTHSREIEGEIMRLMFGYGWLLEIERPAIFDLENGRPTTKTDGVQGWRNPKLRPM